MSSSCFEIPSELYDELERECRNIILQMNSACAYENVPGKWSQYDNSEKNPKLYNFDFILSETDGKVTPKLIEFQGFPSNYLILLDSYKKNRTNKRFCKTLDYDSALAKFKEIVLGGLNPDQVIIVDYKPLDQKNISEFKLTQELCGISLKCVTDLTCRNDQLGYFNGEKWIQVDRIYSRLVPEEINALDCIFPWDVTRVKTEWVVAPAWYYLWSKAVLPKLQSRYIPEIKEVLDFDLKNDDTDEWFLKPNYLYGKRGIIKKPALENIQKILERDQHNWQLMKIVKHEPLNWLVGSNQKYLIELRMLWMSDDPFGLLVRYWPEGTVDTLTTHPCNSIALIQE